MVPIGKLECTGGWRTWGDLPLLRLAHWLLGTRGSGVPVSSGTVGHQGDASDAPGGAVAKVWVGSW